MSLGMLHQDGAILVHRHLPAGPEPFLQAVAPSRTALVVCVACLLPWYGLADLGTRDGMPCVRGPALSLQAMHGGTATNDTLDAQTMAGRLRGGLLPQASGSPAERRTPRELRRRRRPRRRQRAERLTPGPHTTSQDTWPAIGTQSASTTNRSGVAERWTAPAVHTSVEGALARLDADAPRLRDRARALVQTAQPPEAHPLSVLQTGPGSGTSLRLVRVDARHALAHCPRGQDGVSSCRGGTCATAAAGKRSGPSGTTSGTAALPWACAAAAVRCLRHHPAGHQSLAR